MVAYGRTATSGCQSRSFDGVGLIQATEAVKLLLGIGEPLVGRLLVYDALAMTFRSFKTPRRKDCATCGDNAKIDLNAIGADACAGPAA